MKSGFKIVFVYACICLAIFLLQLFPVTGIFLMFFMGPIWITIVVHIMMIHVAVAAGLKTIPRIWLLLPAAFYGASLGLCGFTYWRAVDDAKTIESANAAAKINIAEPYTFLLHGNEPGLIERYRIERLFQHESDYYFSTWMIARGAVCETKRSDPLINGFYQVMRSDLVPYDHGAGKLRQCTIMRRGLDGDLTYRYEIKSEVKSSRPLLAQRTEKVWTVTEEKSGAVVAVVRTARLEASPPVFSAFIGCALNSGAARWDCGFQILGGGPAVFAGYKRPPASGYTLNPPPVPDPQMLETSAVARTLSIPLRTPTD